MVSIGAPLVVLTLTAAAFYLSVRSEARKTPIRSVDLKPFHSLKIIDRNGVLLQEVRCRDGRSSPVRLKNISPHFIRAIIATEDRRFYEHDGVDWRAVVRALTMNIFTGHRRSGASTITLQLAKMLEPGKRTFRKKIGEVKLAYRIEAGMSKEEILEQYLSRLPFGNQLFGVESASQTYFRKRAADLSLAQATFLAALPNAPSELNPYNNPKIGTARQIFILKRMESLRYITPESGRLALKERLEIQKPLRPRTAPHFIQRLLASVAQDVTLVKTTLDARLQESVEHQIKDVIRELKGRVVTNAAVLVLNNHTGEVLAYAGSADFESAENEGQNDGVQALRQPGSALKPFIYGLALERGMTPATVIEDLEVHFATPVGDFSPRNYSKQFHGPVRLREALANSLNVPAVRVTSELGPDAVLERLREFGFESLDADAEHYGVGLALGDGEVSLYELTRAYMFLARGGIPIEVKDIIKTRTSATEAGRQGIKLERVEKRNTQLATKTQRREGERGEVETGKNLSNMRISTPAAVYLITDILKDPYARATEFGTDSVLRMPFPCAVKTGTSRNYRDNWAVGYTRDYTVGVWAGNFNGVPMQQVAGVTGAGPLFRRVMLLLHDRKEPADFDRPKGLAEVEVCSLSGKKRGPACPQGVKEFFLLQDSEGKAMEPCDMHRKLTVHAPSGAIALSAQNRDDVEERIFEDLPPIYEPWQRETGRPAVPREHSLHARSAAFEVIRPAKGAVYKRPLDLAPEYQTIRFEAVGSPAGSTVVWSLNGSEIGRTVGPHFLDWRAQAGEYRLRADAAGSSDEVRFTVE